MKFLFLADVSGRVFHVGDEAMLEANINLFRRLVPGCGIEVAAGPDWKGSQEGVRVLPRLEFSRDSAIEREEFLEKLAHSPDTALPAVEAVLSCNALIISGGGNLCKSWPHHICERLAMARLAASKGIPVLLLGQTLGPEFSPRDRVLVSELLQLAAWTGLRETYSYALALELGAHQERLSYQLDDAAFLEPEEVPAGMHKTLGITAERPWIAVTIHPFSEASIYNPSLVKMATNLRSISEVTGADLVFLPHVAYPEGKNGRGDASFAEVLKQALCPDLPITIAPVLSAAQCYGLTQQAAMVISTRYHPLVFGLAGAVPSLGIWCDDYTRWKLQGALIHAVTVTDGMSMQDVLRGKLVAKAGELWNRRKERREALQPRREIWRKAEGIRRAKLKRVLFPEPSSA